MFAGIRKLWERYGIRRVPAAVFIVVSTSPEWLNRFQNDARYFEMEMETSKDERAKLWPLGLTGLRSGYYKGEPAIEVTYFVETCSPEQIREFLEKFGLTLRLALVTKSFSNIVRSRP